MEKSIVEVQEKANELAEIPVRTPTVKEFKKALKAEHLRREALRDYIGEFFDEGVHFAMTCRRKDGGKWKPVYLKKGEKMLQGDQPGKMEIFQEGAQAAIDVMKCSYIDYPDKEMIEIMGESAKGVIILRGVITSQDGKVVKGYGRGACSLEDKYGSANNAIKQAQIRCMRNAVINAFALSDLFLQDVDDVNNQDLAKKLDASKDERSSMMKKYIDGIFKESKATDKERKQIEDIFDNGPEMYNILRFINEITDPEVLALMGSVGKNKGRPYVVELAKYSGLKLSEFKSMLQTDK